MSEELQSNGSATIVAAPPAPPIDARQVQAALATTPVAAGLVSPFSTESAFGAAQRMAKALSSSSLVPKAYQNNIPNCLIAMELASRIGVSVLATMQNLDIIQGKPSWSAKFLIATVNASGRFTPLRFEWGGKPGENSWACRAVAKDKAGGEICEGPWITWEMAGKEGWSKKSGSKWQTMPQLMFCYRAAAFWSRIYCPEISIGFQTSEEVIDTYGENVSHGVALPDQLTPAGAESLEAVLGIQADAVAMVDAEPAAEVVQNANSELAAAVRGKRESRQTTLDAKGNE